MMADRQLVSARWATSYQFFFLGAVLATWGVRIPDVQERMSLSPAVLGMVLLAMGGGAVMAMLVTGRALHRFGSGRIVRWGALGTILSLPLPLIAPSPWLLAPAALAFGLLQGGLDVSLNAQGVAVERGYDRPVMSSMHALFSIGGLAGAGYAALLLWAGVSLELHLALLIGPLLVGWLAAQQHLLPDVGYEAEEAPIFAWPRGILFWLGLVAVMSMVAEGAVLDWSALYMREVLDSGAAVAAGAFAIFSLTMTVGRLLGDQLVANFGEQWVLCVGGLVAGIGLGGALLAGSPTAALVGFGCLGLGLANVVPVAFSRAGRIPGIGAGHGIAAVSTLAYGGFFLGPPAIGFISDGFGLTVGLGVIPLLALTISVLGAGMQRRVKAIAGTSASDG